MALADIDDVKRSLGRSDLSSAEEGEVRRALESAEEWLTRVLRQDFSESAAATAKLYDVVEDAQVRVPGECSSLTAVRTYHGPN